MSIAPELLTIIFASIGVLATLFFGARRLFSDASGERPEVRFLEEDTLQKLSLVVFKEMDEDVESFLSLPDPPIQLGENYHTDRRKDAARELSLRIFEGSKRQLRIYNSYQAWFHWEEFGRFACSIGAIINVLILIGLLILVISKPALILINRLYFNIISGTIVFLLVAAIVSFIAAAFHRYAYLSRKDENR